MTGGKEEVWMDGPTKARSPNISEGVIFNASSSNITVSLCRAKRHMWPDNLMGKVTNVEENTKAKCAVYTLWIKLPTVHTVVIWAHLFPIQLGFIKGIGWTHFQFYLRICCIFLNTSDSWLVYHQIRSSDCLLPRLTSCTVLLYLSQQWLCGVQWKQLLQSQELSIKWWNFNIEVTFWMEAFYRITKIWNL